MDPAPPRTLRVLGFPAIQERLAELCASALGRERALALAPTVWPDDVARLQRETSEARHLAETAGGLPLRGIRDIRPAVHRAQIGGALGARDLLEIRETLAAGRALAGYVRARADVAPVLAGLAEGITVFGDLEAAIGEAIADDGTILDGASPDLARIRRERRTQETRLRAELERVIRSPAMARMLRDPLITIRHDRFVVPVRAEFREQFPGVVHDSSASGVTVFMEPMAVVPMGNRLRELSAAEEAEIARVLSALSGAVGAASGPIEDTLDALARLDLAGAKAALSLRMDAAEPRLNTEAAVDLRGARHPLLAGTVVPIDLRLGREFRTLVITGPNTGGKTVTLRTLGLLTLMAQSGLHVPAAPGSEVAVFQQVFADIGDEQSVEQNLSTFSSHLVAIVEILEALAATPDVATPGAAAPAESGAPAAALVLLDEIGAGTDPTEGASLARALIEALHDRGARTAVTTHYTELKALAFSLPGVENASVEFDEQTLQPTYRLLIGTPGRSNALVIAARLGLTPGIVERARDLLARRDTDLTRVIQRIEEERAAIARERELLAREQAALAARAARTAEEGRRATEDRRRTLERVQAELDALIRRGRRELDQALAALRASPSAAAAARTRAFLRDLRETADALAAETREPPGGEPPRDLRAGDTVLVLSLGQAGTVQEVPDARGDVEVQVGSLKVRVPLDDLRRAGDSADRAGGTPDRRVGTAAPGGVLAPPADFAAGQHDITAVGPEPVPMSLMVRGMTVDDALLALDKYLDDATVAGLPRVTVIHGKGTGALRRAVHAFLAGHPEVGGYRLGGEGEGGSGATIVELARR